MACSISLSALNKLFFIQLLGAGSAARGLRRTDGGAVPRPLVLRFVARRALAGGGVARLERWRGRSPRILLAPEEFPTFAAVRERWEDVAQEMRLYLATLAAETVDQPMTCTSTRGNTWSYPLWRMMVHLLEHQTYRIT